MRLPGFTAENSTYPTLGHYAGRSFFSSSMPAVVQPQMRRGGLSATGQCCCGKAPCIDCDAGCSCGCSGNTAICVCRAVSWAGLSTRRF